MVSPRLLLGPPVLVTCVQSTEMRCAPSGHLLMSRTRELNRRHFCLLAGAGAAACWLPLLECVRSHTATWQRGKRNAHISIFVCFCFRCWFFPFFLLSFCCKWQGESEKATEKWMFRGLVPISGLSVRHKQTRRPLCLRCALNEIVKTVSLCCVCLANDCFCFVALHADDRATS